MDKQPPHPFFSQHWQAPSVLAVTPLQRDWLEDTGSLTTRLQQLGHLSVHPLTEDRLPLPMDEADFLNLPSRPVSLLREVLLCVDDAPCVYARSLLPLSSLTGDNQALATLEERPLGSELFRFPEARRQRMETCWLPATQIPLELNPVANELLARRSLFMKNNLPLMVAECFLPALWQRLG